MDSACRCSSRVATDGALAGPANANSRILEQLALRCLLLIIVFSLTTTAVAEECVILLHGLARTSSSMESMAEALEDAGFVAVNIDYPSREHPIEDLAPMAIGNGLELCEVAGATDKTHFVAHSLGGILVRKYLKNNEI